jgi:hypothetical protein
MMSALIIEAPLAERIRAIAEREQRPVEAVLETMVEKYASELSHDEIITRLKETGGFIFPSSEPAKPPLTDQERQELADRLGAAGSLSSIIIEERKQGY